MQGGWKAATGVAAGLAPGHVGSPGRRPSTSPGCARRRGRVTGGPCKAIGPAALPELASLYRASPLGERTVIAQIFYNLGWKSEDAKRALLADVRTPDPGCVCRSSGRSAA